MKLKVRGVWLLAVLICALAISACNSGGGGGGSSVADEDTGGTGTGGGNEETPEDLLERLKSADGFAQKGPFSPGGMARIQPLANDGTPDGEGLSTVLDTYGDFRFDDISWHGPSLITVEGDWFSEATGTDAGQPTTLRSVVRIPEDESEPSPFPTAVNVLTTVMTTYVLESMAEGREFDSRVNFALSRIARDLDFPSDPRAINLFVLEGQHPLDQQMSGVFTKLMAALAAKADLTDALELLTGPSAWAASDRSIEMQAIWNEIRADAGALIADNGITDALTLLGNSYDAMTVSRQLSDQGNLGLVASCAPGGADQHGYTRVCLSQRYDFTLEPGDDRLFRFETPHDGAFRFIMGGGTIARDLYVYLSRNQDGSLPSTAHEQVLAGDGLGLGTRILSSGSEVYVRVSLRSSATTSREFSITPARLNAGSATAPRRIYPDVLDEVTLAGGKNGSSTTNSVSSFNKHSYYRFDLADGFSRVRIQQGTFCGSSGAESSFHLYRLSTGDPSQAWQTENLVTQENQTFQCFVDLDLGEGPSTGTYWLKIINHRNTVSGTSGSGSRTRGYTISVH